MAEGIGVFAPGAEEKFGFGDGGCIGSDVTLAALRVDSDGGGRDSTDESGIGSDGRGIETSERNKRNIKHHGGKSLEE